MALWLQHYAAMIDENAAILHDLNAGLCESAGGVVVADSELQPDDFWERGHAQDFVNVVGDKLTASEDVDEIDVFLDFGDVFERFSAKNFG